MRGDRLQGLGEALVMVAILAGLGAAIAGVLLLAHTDKLCGSNPYDCAGTTHPFVGAGLAVLIGGLVQAFLIGAVGMIAQGVGELHEGLMPKPTAEKAATADQTAIPGAVPYGLYGHKGQTTKSPDGG